MGGCFAAEFVVRMLEQFSSANQFRCAAFLDEEREAREGCESLVCRLTGNISQEGFIESLLGFHISLAALVVVFLLVAELVTLFMSLLFSEILLELVGLLMIFLLVVPLRERFGLLMLILLLLDQSLGLLFLLLCFWFELGC